MYKGIDKLSMETAVSSFISETFLQKILTAKVLWCHSNKTKVATTSNIYKYRAIYHKTLGKSHENYKRDEQFK